METKELFGQVKEIFQRIRDLRRDLHRHPELSFREHRTSGAVAAELEKEGIGYRRVAGTGLLARVDGAAPSSRPVVLRADMDALPVCEASGVEFSSVHPGVMHACGHDVHTACLLGALIILHRNRHAFSGTVLGLFQPGEEIHPGGASIVLKEGVLDEFDPVAFVGQHVSPEIEAGKFGFKEGMYMASGDEVHIKVHGTGGHGGLPHTLSDPVVAAAQIITSLQQVASRNAPPDIPTVLSFGRVIADGATNVIPSEVTLAGTLRTMNEEWRQEAKKRIGQIVEGVGSAYGVRTETDVKDGFPNVVNDPSTTRRARAAARELVGEENIVDLDIRMTAEDFGYYTQRYPAVFYRLGAGFPDGRTPGRLHTADLVIDEECLLYGTAMMAACALGFLKTE